MDYVLSHKMSLAAPIGNLRYEALFPCGCLSTPKSSSVSDPG
jgi:hypothetical protein